MATSTNPYNRRRNDARQPTGRVSWEKPVKETSHEDLKRCSVQEFAGLGIDERLGPNSLTGNGWRIELAVARVGCRKQAPGVAYVKFLSG